MSKNEIKRSDGSTICVDRDICIGAATCISLASDVFELDNEQKAVVIDPDASDLDKIMEAAQSCPVDAIKVVDPDGKVLWPQNAS